ncbi:MAG: MerR family DNA-binding transcriptional regulator [Arhodomonas sp.]|nr:MerR family DNA-binding transcriptional regulator [Arhodomonas sp.]
MIWINPAVIGRGGHLLLRLRKRQPFGQSAMQQPSERQPPQNATTYTISELAREFAITTRAIRFYENRGLLTPRREGQRRVYSRRDRTRLKLTLRGKRLGMTLAEIKEVFDLYDVAHGEERQLARYLEILDENANCSSSSVRISRTH